MPPVFSVTSDQLGAWMVAFLWPFVRMLALISTAPIFSEKPVPQIHAQPNGTARYVVVVSVATGVKVGSANVQLLVFSSKREVFV